MAATLRNRIDWGASKDSEGHRTYTIDWLVVTDIGDGPQTAANAPGLPLIGASWSYGTDNDIWAFCYPDMNVQVYKQPRNEPTLFWKISQKFSTKLLNKCCQENVEDPLLQPQSIGGSFAKYTVEASTDRNDKPILSSSFEQFRGSLVEFDANRPVVNIGQNVSSLGLDSFSEMVDTVNDDVLWGLAARKIKLSNVTWERKFYGYCGVYYTRKLDFDIDFKTFDRSLIDEGTKCLNGHWDTEASGTSGCEDSAWILDNICGVAPNPLNPQHFTQYKDRNDENSRCILNGYGLPATSTATTTTGTGTGGAAGIKEVEYYPESNFLTLGIPTSLA